MLIQTILLFDSCYIYLFVYKYILRSNFINILYLNYIRFFARLVWQSLSFSLYFLIIYKIIRNKFFFFNYILSEALRFFLTFLKPFSLF